MYEIIWIVNMMIASILLAKKEDLAHGWMSKAEIAEWFADTMGTTDPQNPIDHLRCKPGGSIRVDTAKFSFCNLIDLVTNGFGLPAYFVQRDGWETKKVLICKDFDSGNWKLISAGCIKHLEGKIRYMLSETDFELFKVSRDDAMIWYECNEEYIRDDRCIQSLEFIFTRKTVGHDGTEQTAPYIFDEKTGVTTHEVPAEN